MADGSSQESTDSRDVFNNLTAWFARSVSARRKTLWIKHGGRLVDVPEAQFIFSQDVEDPDTKSLFDTEDYLLGCLVVFHSAFIDACLKRKSAHGILASKYLLLPADFPKAVQITDVQDDSAPEDVASGAGQPAAQVGRSESPLQAPATTGPEDSGVREDAPAPDCEGDAESHGPTSEAGLAGEPAGERTASGHAGPSVTRTREAPHGEEGEAREEPSDARKTLAKRDTRKKQSKVKELPYDLDLSTVPHVKDLPKAVGSLLDFVVGQNDCKVCMLEKN